MKNIFCKKTQRYDVEFRGDTGENHGVFLYDIPEVSQARKNYETYSVPGRDGELISDDDYRSNITVTCVFSVLNDSFRDVIRDLKQWLSGTGQLRLSESSGYFYEVLVVDHDSIERELMKYGRFTVIFTCYPYEFHDSGQEEISEFPLYNPFETSEPIYLLKGEGKCTLTVNGKSMSANVEQNLTINIRKKISYRDTGELKNTSLTGDYDDLILIPGENKIAVSNGFEIKVIPNWGYRA